MYTSYKPISVNDDEKSEPGSFSDSHSKHLEQAAVQGKSP